MEVLIKEVPEGAVESVKNMAMIAIERYLSQRVDIFDTTKKKEFEDNIDGIRTTNNVDAKYTIIKREV